MARDSAIQPVSPVDADKSLRHNALGLFGAMILGVVIMAPSLAIYTNWGFMIPHVGRATSIVFVISLVMALPTAYSYAVLSRKMPSSGSAYKWTAHLISPRLGIFIGLCASLYYAAIIPYDMPAIALLGSDLVRSTSPWVFGIFLFGSLLLALPIVFRGITVSIETSYILVGLEILILTVIAVAAWVSATHPQATLAPFDASRIPSVSALVPALVLGVLSFTGFDAISTVSEETRTPRRLIPRATILATVLVGIFWIVMSFILSNALPPAVYDKVIAEGGFPLAAAASAAFGTAGRDIIDIMGLEASFGLLIAAVVGSTRVMFAMGRDHVLDRRLGTVHPRFRVPWYAISVVITFAVTVDIAVSLFQGMNYNTALWISNMIVFFALVTYLAINVCNPVYFRRYARDEFNWLRNAVIPAFGFLITAYFFYKGFFQGLWDVPEFKNGRLVVLVAVIVLAICAVAGVLLGRRREAAEAARAYVDESVAAATAAPETPG
jgi:putrescine importer